MCAAPEKTLHTLEDYVSLLAAFSGAAFEYVVIGGCAVGNYARLRGLTVLSGDLDLYTDDETLSEILQWAPGHGIIVVSRPQPRSIPTAFLQWRGKDVNVLTRSNGLPEPGDAVRTARLFRYPSGLEVPVIDPFDLLRNKLEVNRPKDRPHIKILVRFIEEEIVAAFESGTGAGERLSPARRYLRVTDAKTIPRELADRLIPLAKTPPEFRFLVNTVPRRTQAAALVDRAPAPLKDQLRKILALRRLRR